MVWYNSLLCSASAILFTGANGTYCKGLKWPKISRFAEVYSGTRVHEVHCEAKVGSEVFTVATATARGPRVNVGKPVGKHRTKVVFR